MTKPGRSGRVPYAVEHRDRFSGLADDYRRYRQGNAATGLLFSFYLAHHLVPNWLGPPSVHANAEARDTELQVKQTLLWTYLRLIATFPTDPDHAPRWPEGCADDQNLIDAGVIDSLAMVQIILHLEKDHGVDLLKSGFDPAELASVGGILRAIAAGRK